MLWLHEVFIGLGSSHLSCTHSQLLTRYHIASAAHTSPAEAICLNRLKRPFPEISTDWLSLLHHVTSSRVNFHCKGNEIAIIGLSQCSQMCLHIWITWGFFRIPKPRAYLISNEVTLGVGIGVTGISISWSFPDDYMCRQAWGPRLNLLRIPSLGWAGESLFQNVLPGQGKCWGGQGTASSDHGEKGRGLGG